MNVLHFTFMRLKLLTAEKECHGAGLCIVTFSTCLPVHYPVTDTKTHQIFERYEKKSGSTVSTGNGGLYQIIRILITRFKLSSVLLEITLAKNIFSIKP